MKSDSQLKQDVLDELAWDPEVDEREVGVQVKDGIVTLTGHLRSFHAKHLAEQAAQRVQGLRALAVELDVVLPGDTVRTDSDIAWAIENVLMWNSVVPVGQLGVAVERGMVTLSGEVDWDYQRRSAVDTVRPLNGVRGVVNQIVLRPRTSAPDVQQRIEDAMRRQAARDARHVKVVVKDGVVTLSGHVTSMAERQAAFNAAWIAPGVMKVVDDIRVLPQ
ncbi:MULTISPECIES: BON domain-containing protein [unclassified Cupriavidus]|uniref:BON domain-containing protein n=1 Tax=unclassified Cupriavidus TaxID=2640874 RepID=UPI001C00048C|nr:MULTISPECIES: BON domain-containing protein [unclassified Cupriavidus]MCA3183217.1 BON domain-containing protein [Cupriavidus sp.]MCA3194121.1 BON domain-containing protein [Cupriavidus sp.]MCA3199238.1 BON domain-containing protein [Cupriavidus sp.]MCA3209698.1 BON domain-containing protein [Cupriavidus sp.]QWE97144.1 BON domain-containing protein [Cupriavidus sp. EM10]